ncbi:hypothetical protein J2S43_008152 [Catenuloplanes nepalensis]|uniref:DUF1499 domain-containing protein n=1 Tax=Catenuloplanes nepalensis TaxID=587533 RepID=A0ABT9N7G3_9ACTN|nr:hypothetical protein [Catenuloplanes nepalensis]
MTLALTGRLLAGLPRVRQPVYVGSSVLEARTRISWWSFGETITCSLRPEGGGTRIDVESRSTMSLTAVDYGVNRENVRLVMAMIEGAFAPGWPAR